MVTYGSLFTGFGGADIGAIDAGLTPLWGVEYDAKIAAVANGNLGDHIHTTNILDCDPADFAAVDVLHASPPCPSFSAAKANGAETALDIALAQKVADFVTTLRPGIFTLENVWAYRNSKSWRLIEDALYGAGYWLNIEHVNCADFGGEIKCPLHDLECTMSNVLAVGSLSSPDFPKGIAPDIAAALAMMKSEDQAKHLAWDAVAHLVRSIKQDIAENATWHRLVKTVHTLREMKTQDGKVDGILMTADMFVSESTENIDGSIVWLLNKCLDAHLLKAKWFTISMGTKQTIALKILECIRATPIICEIITQKTEKMACPLCKRTSVPQTRKRMIVRAVRGAWVPMLPSAEKWIGWYASVSDLIPSLPETEFAPWQLARLPVEMRTRLYASGGYDGAIVGVDEHDPSMTITANHNQLQLRAFLMGKNQDKFGDGIRQWSEQVQTIDANEHGSKAFVAAGRVVAMTPRCLARFQSFPDWYQLSGNKTLDARGIGNAVPPLLMKKIYQQLLTEK